METSIVVETMSDGSKGHNVVFIDGSQKVVIAAIDKAAAQHIAKVLNEYSAWAQVVPH